MNKHILHVPANGSEWGSGTNIDGLIKFVSENTVSLTKEELAKLTGLSNSSHGDSSTQSTGSTDSD